MSGLSLAQRSEFGWYEAPPPGVERLYSRTDPLRQSISWFVHRLPERTEPVTDFSRDPVISLEVNATGSIERCIDGRWEQADLINDTVTLTPAMTPCNWHWNGDAFQILDVYIPLELLQAAWAEYFNGKPSELNLSPTLRLKDDSLLYLMKSIFHGAQESHRKSHIFHQIATQHLIFAILNSNAQAISCSTWARGTLSARALRRVLSYIEENIAEDISLDDLAGVANVSRFHFLRQFKASIGQTPHRFLMQRRMVHARQLLLDSDLPVAEVAARCGFIDPSHFAERFRDAFNSPPSQFRRNHE